jgi:argininosuccinate lyase
MTARNQRRRSPRGRLTTLWSSGAAPDQLMFAYTAGDDRPWDERLLRWDVLGSLGHVAGLRASRLLTPREHAGLRAALARVDSGRLRVSPSQEDVHTAVEAWLTQRLPGLGERLHTGRSRNDQVATDLRLYLKDRLLTLHAGALAAASALLAFAARHQAILWPGYTHQRRAMPSSVGLWAAGYAEGLLDTAEGLPALWTRIDRSPLGSAAGYGAPLPLKREAAARALGFAEVEHNVATVQGGRGKLEAAALFWCTQLGHELGRLAQDVILFSAEEYGYLVLPAELATGSSIMPHKRNPDLFELTRARAAALEGDLVTLLQVKGKLAGGYQRDFQLLKEPLMRGLDRTEAMLALVASAVPKLGVDRACCTAALDGGALATDEVMRRVEGGQAFRTAYRAVSAELAGGARFPAPSPRAIISRRRSTGGLGNLGLSLARARLRRAAGWQRRERRRFDRAMSALAGSSRRSTKRPRRRSVRGTLRSSDRQPRRPSARRTVRPSDRRSP